MLKGMSNIYKQAQKMQKNMHKIQEELLNLEIDGQSGGGMVKIVVNGKKDPISISINEDVFKEDKDMIEDLILAAMKNALQNAEKIAEEKMKTVTGGSMPNFNIPGF
tara:strand:- start:1607 stop:1927 length:321 start_codon:yes stop_codon:yes gene_type:complete